MKPDTMTLTALNSKQGTVCIFGTGDFGRSLGLRLLQAGYEVVYGSRDPKNSALLPKKAKVMPHEEASQRASVIFLAIHRENYDFLAGLRPALEGKVLVDVSNNLKKHQYTESNAEYLSVLVPGAHVVKAFNTISAWALQSGGLDASRQHEMMARPPRSPDLNIIECVWDYMKRQKDVRKPTSTEDL